MFKKMINKNKKIICILMTICLILPSYASLSGDDDAFVTKEEFDNALSDFNKRLTAFESGINAKIDSQVTSYLDRNGIWSAATQSTANVVYQYKNLCSACATYVQRYIEQKDGTEYIISTNEIIEKITKTGMIYLTASWDKSWSVELHGQNSVQPNWSHALFEGAGKGLISFGVNKKVGATTVYEEYNTLPGFIRIIAGPSGNHTAGDGTVTPNENDGDVIITAGESSIVTMFFVEKNEKLLCKPKLCWGGRSNTTNWAGNYDTNGGCSINGAKTDPTSTTKVTLTFKASVY